MYFYERFGIISYITNILTRKPMRYYKKSIFLVLLWKVFPFLSKKTVSVKDMNYGDIESYADVLKNAYLNGEKFIEQMRYERFFRKSAHLFGIDFVPIFKNHIFNQVICSRYEFFELAIRYAQEHPDEKHLFYINSPKLLTPYLSRIRVFGAVYTNTIRFVYLEYLLSLFLCPVLLWLYWRIKGQRDTQYFENKIIGNAVKVAYQDIFKELFKLYPQTQYVMSLPYLDRYPKQEVEKFDIIPIRLSKAGYRYLRAHVWRYIFVCLNCYRELSRYGLEMLRLFFHIIIGREQAPHGKGNMFITFEHFNSALAIRNEFIRMEGSKSMFFSKHTNIYFKYNYDEAYLNYDIICSASRQMEDYLSLNGTSTKCILPTGSYDAHKEMTVYSRERITKLKSCIGHSNVVITILSCGLVDKSYNIERKLMNLANKISRQPDVRVLVRFKTPFEMPIHDKFYDQFIDGEASVLLTGAEYELMDFLPITDLFITTISSSGYDVVLRGGCTMFVDFLKTPDLFLPWELIKGVAVPEEKSFEEIMRWIRDSRKGPIRTKHKEAMDKLREYIGYPFADFNAYKSNLINALRDTSPQLFNAYQPSEQLTI